MNPSSRKAVNKSKSAAKFRSQTAKTKKVNVAPRPARGGYRG